MALATLLEGVNNNEFSTYALKCAHCLSNTNHLTPWICFDKCMCWRPRHNLFETKCTKSGLKRLFSLSFFLLQFMTSQRKFYMVRICSTIQKRAKRTLNTTVETTFMAIKDLWNRHPFYFHNIKVKYIGFLLLEKKFYFFRIQDIRDWR